MGIARLLAKGWVVFCLFAGAHALRLSLISDVPLSAAAFSIGICVALFAAMGLLFAGGFAVGGGAVSASALAQVKPVHFLPSFNDSVFLIFLILSFLNQALLAPQGMGAPAPSALEAALYFAVPGQRFLVDTMAGCSLDGGRAFASSFTWLLAIIYLASASSRLKLTAGLIRLERSGRPEILGPTLRAFLLGTVAVVGIQFLFIGSAYHWLSCSAFADVRGALLIGLYPLLLAYVIVAALALLLASSPEI